MTNSENLISWLENSREHYQALLKIHFDYYFVKVSDYEDKNYLKFFHEIISLINKTHRDAKKVNDIIHVHSAIDLSLAVSLAIEYNFD